MGTDNPESETPADEVDAAAASAAIAWASGDEPPADDESDELPESAEVADGEAASEEAASAGPAPSGVPSTISEETVVALIAERDEYVEALQRLKAEFANARRRADEQASVVRKQAAADLVNKLLPVLDSAEAALGQGVEEVRPLSDALFDVLASQGLTRLDPVGEAFDPEQHEAVLFESGDGGEQVVVETMRLGYVWNERVLRAAMVKVRG